MLNEAQTKTSTAQHSLNWAGISTIDQAQAIADSITASDWWAKDYSHCVRCEVTKMHGNVTKVNGVADTTQIENGGLIGLTAKGLNYGTLLHEMAHCVAGGDAGHGPQWIRTYLALVYKVVGSDQYLALYNAFKSRELEF